MRNDCSCFLNYYMNRFQNSVVWKFTIENIIIYLSLCLIWKHLYLFIICLSIALHSTIPHLFLCRHLNYRLNAFTDIPIKFTDWSISWEYLSMPSRVENKPLPIRKICEKNSKTGKENNKLGIPYFRLGERHLDTLFG